MFNQKGDLIAAARVTDKTLVVPESIRALEYGKGWVLIVVPWTARAFLRVFTKSELSH
jgi:hypothetical protein